jgi:hypothetical protein
MLGLAGSIWNYNRIRGEGERMKRKGRMLDWMKERRRIGGQEE